MKIGIATLGASGMAVAAQAAPLSPLQIVQRHEAAAAKADVDAMMADYADDAVVLEAAHRLSGKLAIRALFERMFPRAAGGARPANAPKINVVRIRQEGDIGNVTWTMGSLRGLDSFLVKDGKIAVQAVFLNEAEPAAQ